MAPMTPEARSAAAVKANATRKRIKAEKQAEEAARRIQSGEWPILALPLQICRPGLRPDGTVAGK